MKFIVLIFLGINLFAHSSSLPLEFAGLDYSGLNQNKVEIGKNKGLVLVFLSARCPCSNSHIEELKKLKKDFSDFVFVGIHSNMDETQEESLKYFSNLKLPFPVFQDKDAKYADNFAAFKTPHSFVLNGKGELLYQGGVSDSHELKNSQKLFLRSALEDISKGEKVKNIEGRTLGCFIVRKKNNVI